MDISSLLIPGTLCFTELRWEANRLIAYAETGSASASCPLCHELSTRIHSRYHRVLADLPCAGRQVSLQVTVRKFYCPNRGCAGRVFVERLEGVAAACARRTARQQAALESIAFTSSGVKLGPGWQRGPGCGKPAANLLRQPRRRGHGSALTAAAVAMPAAIPVSANALLELPDFSNSLLTRHLLKVTIHHYTGPSLLSAEQQSHGNP